MLKKPITNCHVHSFTADHVPPFLAKSYLPWPFFWFLPLNVIVACFRFWYKYPARIPYSVFYKKWVRFRTSILIYLNLVYPLRVLAGYYIFFFAFSQLFHLFNIWYPDKENHIPNFILNFLQWIQPFFPNADNDLIRIGIIAVVFIFLPSIRNIILLLAKLLWKVVTKLPGPKTLEMFGRYLNIGRYAFHKEQKTIISKLKSQYPPNTRFVILPMDMDYMAAYKSKIRYRDQMQELAEVKSMPSNKQLIFPFIFADPRRMVSVKEEKRSQPNDIEYFKYSVQNGKIVLGDCFMKEYLEDKQFSGIKIYPALGYYPFDEKLLPLWKYAADHQIPIMTHCIKGTIFYRGVKKMEWNEHPVFMQAMKKRNRQTADQNETDGYETATQMEREADVSEGYIPLVLPQVSNATFSYNFTHPLNYLCLLEEHLLRKLVSKAVQEDPNSPLIQMFGYNGEENPLTHDLSKLKICLAHFGGDDEWKQYFEKDRYNYSSQLIQNPEKGIDFFKTVAGKPSPGKMEQLWNHSDWYSIICSLMLQYDNVYADISYILHGDKEILPLLKQTLQNPGLREKVLYGSDFFVVRNHKSDKNMLADMLGGLSENEFDCIARNNPEKYLARK